MNKYLPNSKIKLIQIKMDSNGNKSAYFICPDNTKIKVQTNGNMPKTHALSCNANYSDDELLWVRKELMNYLFNCGVDISKLQ